MDSLVLRVLPASLAFKEILAEMVRRVKKVNAALLDLLDR